jgi:hypothetical protein
MIFIYYVNLLLIINLYLKGWFQRIVMSCKTSFHPSTLVLTNINQANAKMQHVNAIQEMCAFRQNKLKNLFAIPPRFYGKLIQAKKESKISTTACYARE